MERNIVITSKDNPRYRSLVSLHDRKVAREEGVVFIEGLRLCEDALISGMVPKTMAIRMDKYSLWEEWKEKYPILSSTELLVFSDTLFDKMCQTLHPQGVALIVSVPAPTSLMASDVDSCRYIVLEHLQDPGNMGTIIRMADAFAYDAVLYTADCVDPYNEKALRASMGSCFHIPLVAFANSDEIIAALRICSIQSIGAHLKGAPLKEAILPKKAALWIGNEANGLTEQTSNQCDILVKIEMPGRAESLNAASAASILGYILAQQ